MEDQNQQNQIPTSIYLSNKTVVVDNERNKNKVTVLGMEFGTRGVSSLIKRRLATAKFQYTKLKRFAKMSSKIQLHFYKTLIRPIMEYPAIPLCISSKTNITKMQQFLNRVLRTATRRNEEDNLLSIAELHNKYKVETINTRLYNLARKVWDKLETIDGELTARSLEENNFPLVNDH